MHRMLLTGFAPFGGEKVNPTERVVAALQGSKIAGIEVETRILPVVFGLAAEQLLSAYEEIHPNLVICMGEAGGRPHISVEAIAINTDDARIPDNAGNQPLSVPIMPRGPAAYWSTLPVRELVDAMNHVNIPATISYTAGTFVCNHIFYRLMHHLHQHRSRIPAGFIHVPYLPEQAVAHPNAPSMDATTITNGITLCIETVLTKATPIANKP